MNMTAFLLFLAIVGLTLIITYFAAKKTKTTSEFYTAGGGLTGVQNGLAIAGDYMSAASFLALPESLLYMDLMDSFTASGFWWLISLSCTSWQNRFGILGSTRWQT